MRTEITRKTLLGCLATLLIAGTATAQCPNDDSFEENDDCLTAALIPTGLTTGLVEFAGTGTQDDDWYYIDVPDGNTISVTVLFVDALGDIDCEMHDITGSCPGMMIDSSSSGTDNEVMIWTNNSGFLATVALKIFGYGSAYHCNDYDLDISVGTAVPCPSDDTYEENDDCALAAPIVIGLTPGLVVFGDGCPAVGFDPDWYTFGLAADEQVYVDCLFTHRDDGDIDIELYDITGGCPGNPAGASASATDNEFINWSNNSGAPVTMALKIQPWGTNFRFNTYAVGLTTAPITTNPCLIPDDGFEDNDTCSSAAPITAGMHTGLVVFGLDCGIDEDYYSITLADGDRINVDAYFFHDTANYEGDIDMRLYDVTYGCPGPQLAISDTFGDDESFQYDNHSGAPMDLVIWMETYANGSTRFFHSNTYDLEIQISTAPPDPCTIPDDLYEDNDDCFSAAPMTAGVYNNLVVFGSDCGLDEDYYSITIPDGAQIGVDVLFFHDTVNYEGDIELHLYDVTGGCPGVQVASSTTFGDDEHVLYDNTSGAAMDLVIRIEAYSNGIDRFFHSNTYDMAISVSGSTSFCFGDALCPCGNNSAPGSNEGCVNGTGVGAFISASGTPSVSVDTLQLTVSQAVPSDFGIFVQNVALSGISAPFYNGLFCLAGDSHLVRHYAPPTVMPTVTDTTGTGVNAQPMTVGDYLNDSQPGVTVYYQFWGRDNAGICGAGANFSAGVYLTWLP